jgi:hypothetical protein
MLRGCIQPCIYLDLLAQWQMVLSHFLSLQIHACVRCTKSFLCISKAACGCSCIFWSGVQSAPYTCVPYTYMSPMRECMCTYTHISACMRTCTYVSGIRRAPSTVAKQHACVYVCVLLDNACEWPITHIPQGHACVCVKLVSGIRMAVHIFLMWHVCVYVCVLLDNACEWPIAHLPQGHACVCVKNYYQASEWLHTYFRCSIHVFMYVFFCKMHTNGPLRIFHQGMRVSVCKIIIRHPKGLTHILGAACMFVCVLFCHAYQGIYWCRPWRLFCVYVNVCAYKCVYIYISIYRRMYVHARMVCWDESD